jgi:hypothetical protein
MKNIVKGGIAALGIAGAMATGIGLAGSASAAPIDHDTLVYLQMLNNDGLTVTDTSQAIRFAGTVCADMRYNGWDAHQIANYNWSPSLPMTYQNMLDQVEDAAIVFCPAAWQAVISGPSSTV